MGPRCPSERVVRVRRLSAAEAAAAGHETSLSVRMGPLTYVHTKRFLLELQAFARDFSLLRRVIAQARRKVGCRIATTSIYNNIPGAK